MVTFAQIYLFYKHFNPTYLHLPHFLLKVHQLVLKASSDANGDLCIVKMAEKGSYSPPADPSPAPASLSLCPEGPSPAGVPVVKWLLDCLTFSSTPLCLFVTHPPIFLDFGKFVFVFLSSSQHISCYFCFRISDSITLSIRLGTWHLWRADSISFAQNTKISHAPCMCWVHSTQLP